MAKHKRNVWDELLEAGRRILKELDEFLDPKSQPERRPARAPIPVRSKRRGSREEN